MKFLLITEIHSADHDQGHSIPVIMSLVASGKRLTSLSLSFFTGNSDGGLML